MAWIMGARRCIGEGLLVRIFERTCGLQIAFGRIDVDLVLGAVDVVLYLANFLYLVLVVVHQLAGAHPFVVVFLNDAAFLTSIGGVFNFFHLAAVGVVAGYVVEIGDYGTGFQFVLFYGEVFLAVGFGGVLRRKGESQPHKDGEKENFRFHFLFFC